MSQPPNITLSLEVALLTVLRLLLGGVGLLGFCVSIGKVYEVLFFDPHAFENRWFFGTPSLDAAEAAWLVFLVFLSAVLLSPPGLLYRRRWTRWGVTTGTIVFGGWLAIVLTSRFGSDDPPSLYLHLLVIPFVALASARWAARLERRGLLPLGNPARHALLRVPLVLGAISVWLIGMTGCSGREFVVPILVALALLCFWPLRNELRDGG